jgi:hypothetical protein
MLRCAKKQQMRGPQTTTIRTVTITMAAVHDDAPEELELLSDESVEEVFAVRTGRAVGRDARMEVKVGAAPDMLLLKSRTLYWALGGAQLLESL